jgi:hypothetical protein
LICVKLWACKQVAINGKYFKNVMTIQAIMLHLWSFKIQKCNFKKCPLNWVAPFIVFLPIFYIWKWIKINLLHLSNYPFDNMGFSKCFWFFYVHKFNHLKVTHWNFVS